MDDWRGWSRDLYRVMCFTIIAIHRTMRDFKVIKIIFDLTSHVVLLSAF